MSNLLDELKKRSDAAKLANAMQAANRRDAKIAEDIELARKIIAQLPTELKLAANSGNSLVVMSLNKELHVSLPPADEDNIKFIAQSEGVLTVLKGAAYTVAEFLQKEGITVSIEVVQDFDRDQGQSWSTYRLLASW